MRIVSRLLEQALQTLSAIAMTAPCTGSTESEETNIRVSSFVLRIFSTLAVSISSNNSSLSADERRKLLHELLASGAFVNLLKTASICIPHTTLSPLLVVEDRVLYGKVSARIAPILFRH